MISVGNLPKRPRLWRNRHCEKIRVRRGDVRIKQSWVNDEWVSPTAADPGTRYVSRQTQEQARTCSCWRKLWFYEEKKKMYVTSEDGQIGSKILAA